MRQLIFVCGLLALFTVSVAQAASAARQPNIIVILSDDMGFSDVAPFGSEIDTPALQRMAREGLRFSQFYNTPRCSPTRAALLTGRYSHAVGMGHLTNLPVVQLPGYARELRTDNNMTMAEVLSAAGYRTHAIGKWHVTQHDTIDVPPAQQFNWPLQRGFDRYYGILVGAGRFFDPTSLLRDNSPISPFSAAEQALYPRRYYDVQAYEAARRLVADDASARPSAGYYYLTDAISDHAVRFIDEHFNDPASRQQPLFQYIAYTAAHWPLHAKPEDIAKYRGVYRDGYEAIRARRFAAAKAAGVIAADTMLPLGLGEWRKLDSDMRALEEQAMQAYAAQIDSMDQGIDRVLQALERHGQLDDTLVLYMQDNGGNHEGGLAPNQVPQDVPQRPAHPIAPRLADDVSQPDYLLKAPSRDGYPMRKAVGVEASAPDTYQFYSKQWGNVSNTPFQEYKSDTGEGGIATPLIVRWGNGIDRRLRGTVITNVSHVIDIMATLVEAAGARFPTSGARGIEPLDGISLIPAFSGGHIQRNEALYWEHEGWRAVRDDRWKALTRGPDGVWELYDMKKDRVESHNVAAAHPEVVRRMARRWQSWALANHVIDANGNWPWTPHHVIEK